MKLKHTFLFLSLFAMIMSCSSSDDSDDGNDDMQMIPIASDGHFNLRVNGNGYQDEAFVFNRDTINGTSTNFLILASGANFTDYIALRLPGLEVGNNTIVPYVNGDPNTASFVIQNDGIYLCEDGNINITEVNGEFSFDGCFDMKGTLDINFRRQDNTPGNINVSGTFDLPSVGCGFNN